MKKNIQLLTSLTCLLLWQASVQGATKYWDINGATSGAGGASPAGIWDTGTTANWTADSTGASVGTTWASGDDAVFSAGTDATGAFAITLDSAASVQNAGNLTVEEGALSIIGDTGIYLNIGGGVAGKGIINVASGASLTNIAPLDDTYSLGDDLGLLWKTGAGALTLSSNSFYGATIIVAEGVLVTTETATLGLTTSPTIVSNGATLQISGTIAANVPRNEPLYVSGDGDGGSGVIRNTVGCRMAGGLTLDGPSRFNAVTGELRWDVFTPDRNFDLVLVGNGNHRLNVNGGFKLGTGKLTKEGTGHVQTEGVVYNWSAFDFNDGIVRFRELPGGGFKDPTNVNFSPFTIGANADEIRTVQANNITVGNAITLNAPNLLITPISGSTLTFSGVISGSSGGLSKAGPGTLFLNKDNTYSGNTTIQGGTLSLWQAVVVGNPPTATNYYNGSISNSPVIDVQGPTASLNVSNDFVLEATQTLKCNGTCNFSNSLTLLGHLSNLGVDKSVSTPKITVLGPVLTNAVTGTLTVTNTGWLALAVGDSFQIFNKALSNGLALTVAGTAGVVWTNKLAEDGTIAVLSAPGPVAATNLAIQAISPTSFQLTGFGAPGNNYAIFTSTNVAAPTADWWLIGVTNSTAGGVIQFVDPKATNDQRYYRFAQ